MGYGMCLPPHLRVCTGPGTSLGNCAQGRLTPFPQDTLGMWHVGGGCKSSPHSSSLCTVAEPALCTHPPGRRSCSPGLGPQGTGVIVSVVTGWGNGEHSGTQPGQGSSPSELPLPRAVAPGSKGSWLVVILHGALLGTAPASSRTD